MIVDFAAQFFKGRLNFEGHQCDEILVAFYLKRSSPHYFKGEWIYKVHRFQSLSMWQDLCHIFFKVDRFLDRLSCFLKIDGFLRLIDFLRLLMWQDFGHIFPWQDFFTFRCWIVKVDQFLNFQTQSICNSILSHF